MAAFERAGRMHAPGTMASGFSGESCGDGRCGVPLGRRVHHAERCEGRAHLRDDVVHDLALHVGQPEIAAGVVVGQLFVIEAEQLQHGGMEIVDVDGLVHGLKAELVGRAEDGAALDPAAGEPRGEAVVIVVGFPRSGCGRIRRSKGPAFPRAGRAA